MKHSNRWLAAVLIIAGLHISACTKEVESSTTTDVGPADVVAVQGTDLARQTVIRGPVAGVVQIEGPLSSRIRLLSGALVSVCGVRESAAKDRVENGRRRDLPEFLVAALQAALSFPKVNDFS